MRAFQYIFNEGLGGGLRRFSSNPRNKQSLTECHNAMPTEDGLRPHEVITSLDADDIDWDSVHVDTSAVGTANITISIKDYVSDIDLEGVKVYLDGTLQGTTDSDGDIDLVDITVGIHPIRLTLTDYVDSNLDDLYNDYIVVTD
jgi:hypothetical protein